MSLPATGLGDDLYITYMLHPHKTLPDPPGFPFHIQGQPIYFDQPHTSPLDIAQATQDKPTNPLPFNHFVGVGVNGGPPRQINQPDFLGINEDIFLQ